MQALVIGAGGFVGSALLRALCAMGHEARGLSRDPARARERVGVGPGLEDAIEQGSVADPNAIAAAAEGCDVVFVAAGINDPRAAAQLMHAIHVAGIENVLKAARHVGVRRVVMISSAEVTLTDADRMHWDEKRALPAAPLGELARAKLLAEELALADSDDELEAVALRPSWLWGKGDFSGIARLAHEARSGGVRLYGGGRNILATTHIQNLVHAALAAATAQSSAGKAYYVTDGEFLEAREILPRWLEAIGLAGRTRNASLPLSWLKRRAQRLVSRAAETDLAELAQRAHSALFDLSQATLDLGYQPQVSFEQGASELAAWIAELGGLEAVLKRDTRAQR